MKNVSLWVASLLALSGSSGLLAQNADYPNKPIRIVVPFAPGGATDAIARVVAQKSAELLGQPMIVENKAGANGNIGAMAVARAAPDGYSILMATSSHAINASLYRKLDYSLTTDLAALSNLASVPLLLVVNPALPVKTVAELAAYAKANVGTVNFASGGTGTAAHLAGEQFNAMASVHMMHVPYKGGALAQTDLIGGQVQAMFANLPEVLQHVQSGRLRAIAVTGNSRRSVLPNVQTFTEAGFAQMDAKSWFGFFVPAGTPAPIMAKLSLAVMRAVADPSVQAKLKEMGADPLGDESAAFQKFVGLEVERWRVLVQRSSATVD